MSKHQIKTIPLNFEADQTIDIPIGSQVLAVRKSANRLSCRIMCSVTAANHVRVTISYGINTRIYDTAPGKFINTVKYSGELWYFFVGKEEHLV